MPTMHVVEGPDSRIARASQHALRRLPLQHLERLVGRLDALEALRRTTGGGVPHEERIRLGDHEVVADEVAVLAVHVHLLAADVGDTPGVGRDGLELVHHVLAGEAVTAPVVVRVPLVGDGAPQVDLVLQGRQGEELVEPLGHSGHDDEPVTVLRLETLDLGLHDLQGLHLLLAAHGLQGSAASARHDEELIFGTVDTRLALIDDPHDTALRCVHVALLLQGQLRLDGLDPGLEVDVGGAVSGLDDSLGGEELPRNGEGEFLPLVDLLDVLRADRVVHQTRLGHGELGRVQSPALLVRRGQVDGLALDGHGILLQGWSGQ